MRLIDAAELIEIINYTFSKPPFSRKTIKHMIDMARTVDAVPVVRCKDCKYYHEDSYGEDEWIMCRRTNLYTDEDKYCAWAERVKNGSD